MCQLPGLKSCPQRILETKLSWRPALRARTTWAPCGAHLLGKGMHPSLMRKRGHSRHWHQPLPPMATQPAVPARRWSMAGLRLQHGCLCFLAALSPADRRDFCLKDLGTELQATLDALVFPGICCWAPTGESANTGRNSLASLLEVNPRNNMAALSQSQGSKVAERRGKPSKGMTLLKLGR